LFEAFLMPELTVKSSAFNHNQQIPRTYTCDGKGINPPLTIEGTPKEAKTLALVFEDPDATIGTFDHWVVWNIPASTGKIEEDSAPGTEGLNSGREIGYYPPCPPYGTHRYIFKVYALDVELGLNARSRKQDVEKAMQGHVLAKGELIGLYSR
jgi:Raf kinase inhibitor-like YbhB/YbcL family protein